MENKNNLEIYNIVAKVPDEALKTIGAGRLKGMSDINPMWRIKILTDVFGMCGFGWKYTITKQWLETYGNEVKGFVNIDLFVKHNGEWSDAIPGTGGSSFVSQERQGAYVSDEVFKMALTDAISVAAKALGVGASIYFGRDKDFGTKYDTTPHQIQQPSAQSPSNELPISVLQNIGNCTTIEQLKALWKQYPHYQQNQNFTAAFTARKDVINQNNKQ